MLFNPSTNELFTNNGQLIKKLQCPYRVTWDTLKEHPVNNTRRQCSQCDHSIIDTSCYDEESLLRIMAGHPGTCLKVSINHPNIRLING